MYAIFDDDKPMAWLPDNRYFALRPTSAQHLVWAASGLLAGGHPFGERELRCRYQDDSLLEETLPQCKVIEGAAIMPGCYRVQGEPEVILPPDGVRIKAGIMLVRNRVGSNRREVWHIQWQSGDNPGLSVRAGIEGMGSITGSVRQQNFRACSKQHAAELMVITANTKLGQGYVQTHPAQTGPAKATKRQALKSTGTLGAWFF